MKPPPFEYFDPPDVASALVLLEAHGETAKVLAGGQSLVPLLSFRLVRPECVIDLNRIEELSYIRERNGGLAIGALTRQRDVERSPLVRARAPLLAEAVPLIGHPAIRNRGTVGGSLAHADPAAELPAVVTALGGELVLHGPGGERVLPAEQFFVSYLTTAIRPDELLVEVRLPGSPPRTGAAFLEISRRHGDFALVAAAATVTLDERGICTGVTAAVGAVGPVPLRVADVASSLVGTRPDERALEDVGRRVSARVEADSDLHASAEYRREVAGVLIRRALARALARARGESE